MRILNKPHLTTLALPVNAPSAGEYFHRSIASAELHILRFFIATSFGMVIQSKLLVSAAIVMSRPFIIGAYRVVTYGSQATQ